MLNEREVDLFCQMLYLIDELCVVDGERSFSDLVLGIADLISEHRL